MTTTSQSTGTTMEHEVGPRGRFTLRQSSGEVAVRGVEGGTVRVRSLDGRLLADLFDVQVSEETVELRQNETLGMGFKLRGRREGAELEIEVPHGATVSIDTQSADIDASDLSGVKKFRSASGEVTLNRLAGPVEIETVSGEIELDANAPVDIIARSVSGDMQLRVPTIRRLELSTTSGDVRLDAALAGDGPFLIRSISGDVTIVGRGGMRVEAESITGDLSSDLPSRRESTPGRKVLVVGRPGPTLSFRSVSGDFHVAQPRDAAPPSTPVALEASPPPPASVAPLAPEAPETALSENVPQETAPRVSTSPDDVDAEDARMEILRALERGDITVAAATDRLSRLEEAVR